MEQKRGYYGLLVSLTIMTIIIISAVTASALLQDEDQDAGYASAVYVKGYLEESSGSAASYHSATHYEWRPEYTVYMFGVHESDSIVLTEIRQVLPGTYEHFWLTSGNTATLTARTYTTILELQSKDAYSAIYLP